jgi:hypothetical protein
MHDDRTPNNPRLDIGRELAGLAAEFGGGWAFRHDDGGLWWAERPGALLGADSAESLRLLLTELAAPPRDEA